MLVLQELKLLTVLIPELSWGWASEEKNFKNQVQMVYTGEIKAEYKDRIALCRFREIL